MKISHPMETLILCRQTTEILRQVRFSLTVWSQQHYKQPLTFGLMFLPRCSAAQNGRDKLNNPIAPRRRAIGRIELSHESAFHMAQPALSRRAMHTEKRSRGIKISGYRADNTGYRRILLQVIVAHEEPAFEERVQASPLKFPSETWTRTHVRRNLENMLRRFLCRIKKFKLPEKIVRIAGRAFG